MQVTSIRLEPELKERLREISGEQGYQTLIRDILWQFVEQTSVDPVGASCPTPLLARSEIRAKFRAIAQREERCAISGDVIQPQQMMWLGLTTTGRIVSLKG